MRVFCPMRPRALTFGETACVARAMQSMTSHSQVGGTVLVQPSQYYHLIICNRYFQAWAQRPWQAGAHHIEHSQMHATLTAVAQDCHNSFSGVQHVTECLAQHWMWAVAFVPVSSARRSCCCTCTRTQHAEYPT